MARVNVEQKALTDLRFRKLGRLLLGEQVDSHIAQSVGIGFMTFVWNECQERGNYTLRDDDLDLINNRQRSADLLITAGLAKREKADRVRIKGTRDRIEWLHSARENGKKGGRPPKNPQETDAKPNPFEKPKGSENPPAPAPAPAPVEKKKTPSESKKKTALLLADDWQPKIATRQWAATKFPRVDFDAELEAFRDWHIGKGSTWSDWDRALMTWIRKAKPSLDAQRGLPAFVELGDDE
jgi:hypothetical protein